MNAVVAIVLLTLLLEARLFSDLGAAARPAATPAAPDSADKASGCRRHSRGHHLDITQNPGVLIERAAGSRIDILGSKFPISSQPTTTVSFEFVVRTERALLFHAESEDGKHELSAWIDRGTLKVRLVGWCLWLVHDETLRHRGNVSDGASHTITLEGKRADGVTVRLDGRHDMFFLHTSRVLSCWHVDNFYFGGPGPKRQYAEGNGNSEYSFKMVGCIRNLTLDPADGGDATFLYRRASTCPHNPAKASSSRR